MDLGLIKCKQLSNPIETIDLSFNKLNNTGITSCLLKSFPQIRSLNLSHNLFKRFTVDWQFMNTSLEYLVSGNKKNLF